MKDLTTPDPIAKALIAKADAAFEEHQTARRRGQDTLPAYKRYEAAIEELGEYFGGPEWDQQSQAAG